MLKDILAEIEAMPEGEHRTIVKPFAMETYTATIPTCYCHEPCPACAVAAFKQALIEKLKKRHP